MTDDRHGELIEDVLRPVVLAPSPVVSNVAGDQDEGRTEAVQLVDDGLDGRLACGRVPEVQVGDLGERESLRDIREHGHRAVRSGLTVAGPRDEVVDARCAVLWNTGKDCKAGAARGGPQQHERDPPRLALQAESVDLCDPRDGHARNDRQL